MIQRRHQDLQGLTGIYLCYILSGYLIQVNGHIYEVGRERDKNNEWKWLLPYPDLCKCTRVNMGGINTWTPIRTFVPRYYDSPLLSDDVNKIRWHYGMQCDDGNAIYTSTAFPSTSAIATKNVQRTGRIVSTHTESLQTWSSSQTTRVLHRVSTNTANVINPSATSKVTSDAASKSSTSTALPATDASTVISPQVCFDYLGMENGDIPDEGITASSVQGNGYTWRARLNGNQNWRALFGATAAVYHPWIQADIGYQTFVSGVLTQGDGGRSVPDWVTTLKVSTLSKSTNDTEVIVQDDSGNDKIFDANSDTNTVEELIFPVPSYAKIIRITCLTGRRNTKI